MRWLVALLLTATLATPAIGGGTCSGVKGGCGRSSPRTTSRSSSPGGTVHVSGYTRKDGTYVRPHTRRSPGTAKQTDVANTETRPNPPPTQPAKHRTTARTTARTNYWNGKVTDEQEHSPTPVVARSEAVNLRIWTSSDGMFSVEAEFVSLTAGMVKLKKVDGSIITVALEKLSRSDREWIDRRRSR